MSRTNEQTCSAAVWGTSMAEICEATLQNAQLGPIPSVNAASLKTIQSLICKLLI
jgi:hypothetical protein